MPISKRLTSADVDGLLEKFRAAKAIVFDARGASREISERLAARLTEERDAPAAVFTGPLTMTPDVPQSGIATAVFELFLCADDPEFRASGSTRTKR